MMDSTMAKWPMGDSLMFIKSIETLGPYAIDFYENGEFKTIDFWAWCGTRSFSERFFRRYKTTYVEGDWEIIVKDSSTFIKMYDKKYGNSVFEKSHLIKGFLCFFFLFITKSIRAYA